LSVKQIETGPRPRLVAATAQMTGLWSTDSMPLLPKTCIGGLVYSVYGVGLVINRSRVRLPAVHCRVTTEMGDRLCGRV